MAGLADLDAEVAARVNAALPEVLLLLLERGGPSLVRPMACHKHGALRTHYTNTAITKHRAYRRWRDSDGSYLVLEAADQNYRTAQSAYRAAECACTAG